MNKLHVSGTFIRAPDPGQSYTKAKFKLRFRHPSVFSPEHFKGLIRTRTPEFIQTDLQALTKLYTYLVGHDLVILDKTGFDVVWSTAVTIMPSTLFLPSSLHSSLDIITSNVFASTPGLTLYPSHIHGSSTVYVLYGKRYNFAFMWIINWIKFCRYGNYSGRFTLYLLHESFAEQFQCIFSLLDWLNQQHDDVYPHLQYLNQ